MLTSCYEKICRGDREAWELIVTSYRPVLAARVRRMGVTERDDIDEIAQETFLVAWEKFAQFRGEQGVKSFLRWLSQIAFNKSRDFLKSRDRDAAPGGTDYQRRMHDQEEVPLDPLGPLMVREMLEIAERRGISAETVEILIKHGQNYTSKEIAHETGMQPAAVRQRISRYLPKLEAVFAGLESF